MAHGVVDAAQEWIQEEVWDPLADATGLGDEWDDMTDALIYDDDGNMNILGLGDEWDHITSGKAKFSDFGDWLDSDFFDSTKWNKIFFGEGIKVGDSWYTGETTIDEDGKEVPVEVPDEEVIPEDNTLSRSEWDTEADTYWGQLEDIQQLYKGRIDPRQGGQIFSNTVSAIEGIQRSQETLGLVQAAEDAPINLATGGTTGIGYQDLDTAAIARESVRTTLAGALGDYEFAGSSLENQKGQWDTAKFTYGQAEDVLEQAGKEVKGRPMEDTTHMVGNTNSETGLKEGEFGFQDYKGDWYYWQGIDEFGEGTKMQDNPETNWIDESRYTSGTLGDAYFAHMNAGMDKYHWDAASGEWITDVGMGTLGQASAQYNLVDMPQWAEDQADFREGGDWHWQNTPKPEGWESLPGEPDTPPDYDTTNGTGFWSRGTWGEAQDIFDIAVADYNKAHEDLKVGNKTAWEVWRESMSDEGSKLRGLAGGSEAGQYRREAENLFRQTGLAGSGAIDRAEDLDIQENINRPYQEAMSSFGTTLGRTRRQLDERLYQQKANWEDAIVTREIAGSDYSAASTAYGGPGDEANAPTGIFAEYQQDIYRRQAAEAALALAQTNYETLGGQGINDAQAQYNIATGVHDTATQNLQTAYGQYGPPTSEYDPASDFLGDELADVPGMDDGGQIYSDYAQAGRVWDTARGIGQAEGFTIPDVAPYGGASDWGADYSGIDWSDSANWGMDIPATGDFGGAYFDFTQNTVPSYGSPPAWQGQPDQFQHANMEYWGSPGIGSAYGDLMYYTQPDGGYAWSVENKLGAYEGKLAAQWDLYAAEAKETLGGTPAGMAQLMVTEVGASQEEKDLAMGAAEEFWDREVWKGYGMSGAPQGMISAWSGGKSGFDTSFGISGGAGGVLGEYDVQGATMPGYARIQGPGNTWDWRYSG